MDDAYITFDLWLCLMVYITFLQFSEAKEENAGLLSSTIASINQSWEFFKGVYTNLL